MSVTSTVLPGVGEERDPSVDRGPVWARVGSLAPDGAVVAALAWWATWLTWGTGGREPHVLSVGCLLTALALLAARPWRTVPAWAQLLVHGVGAAAWLVVLTAPTGSAGRDDAAAYTFAAELGLVTVAWARDPVRRQVVLTTLVGAAGAQFALGWLPWWGMQDTMRLFEGTFYWHNQAGIFLAAGAVLGLAAVAAGRPVSLLGWTITPFCVAGTVYTTSRGSEIALGLGAVLLLLLLRRRHLQVLAAGAVSVAVTWALTGPPFFPERVSPTAGTEARAASLVGNGVQRFEDWRRAWEVFLHWPWTGAGFNSFDSAAGIATTRHDDVRTAFAHNGFLQLLSDGGLVLAVPFLALLGVVAWRAIAGIPSAVRAPDPARAGAVVVLVMLGLHSGMDFDWGYPALLAMLAPVAALAGPPGGDRGTAVRARYAVALVGLGVVLLAAGAVGGWGGGLDLSATVA